jgi:hypothetical protein
LLLLDRRPLKRYRRFFGTTRFAPPKTDPAQRAMSGPPGFGVLHFGFLFSRLFFW